MNTLYIFIPCGHDFPFSIEQVIQELAAQIKVVSADLEISRAELILARTRAHNYLKQAIKTAQVLETNCDHATSDQRQRHLIESDRDAALAADEYIELMETIKHLSNELHDLTATHAAALGILQEQEKIEEPNDKENTDYRRPSVWH